MFQLYAFAIAVLVSIISHKLGNAQNVVYLRGTIGSACGEKYLSSIWFDKEYKAAACASNLKKPVDKCPAVELRANVPDPIYTNTHRDGPTVTNNVWITRWAIWLAVDSSTKQATLATMRQTKHDQDAECVYDRRQCKWSPEFKPLDWCNGLGTTYKNCYWRNYTITPCSGNSLVSLQLAYTPFPAMENVAIVDVWKSP